MQFTVRADDRLMTLAEVAERLGVNERHLSALDGLPVIKLSHKIRRVPESGLNAYLASRITTAA